MTDLFPGHSGFRQLAEWGYPKGNLRPVPPAALAFSVVHITGNPGNPIATAIGELAWRIGDPADQNSATFFVNRDGSVWQGLGDPLRMAPWANGDLQRPDLTSPRVAALAGTNPNLRTIVAIENVGRPTDLPITEAQVQANARIIAYYHAKARVPVTRQTVIGHYQINGVNRPNCPAIDKRVIDRIVALAQPAPETDMPVLTKPVRERWRVPAGMSFWLGGPGYGTLKVFDAPIELWSNGETEDGKWRRLEYHDSPAIGEELWALRKSMTPLGGRNPAKGYGPPTGAADCSVQDKQLAEIRGAVGVLRASHGTEGAAIEALGKVAGG